VSRQPLRLRFLVDWRCRPKDRRRGPRTDTSNGCSILTAKTRIGELKAKGNDRAAADFVSSLQQLFCSFDGTGFLIRAVGSPVQACQNRGWVAFQTNLF